MSLRIQKVNSLLLRELSLILQRKVEDPRVQMVTVLDVKVSHDLRNARVFISATGDPEKDKTLLSGLERARRFIQKELCDSVFLRYVPELHFELDSTLLKAEKIERIIEDLHESGDLT